MTELDSLASQQQYSSIRPSARNLCLRQVTFAVQHSLLCFGALLLLASLQGCSGAPDDQPEVASVKGTVLVDGQPMKDLQVEFFPKQGRQSMGVTDDLGQYTLLYIRNIKGAKIGPHQVVITVRRNTLPDSEEIEPESFKLPPIYNVKSTLVADVQPGENVIDFELKTTEK